MPIPENITKHHLIQAFQKIDSEGLPKDGESQYYDVVFQRQEISPKLVVSFANLFANGEVLDRSTFAGGKGTQCFKLLEKNGFSIEEKLDVRKVESRIWLEKTIVANRGDRSHGDRALGKALWSPQRSKDGKDIYKNMRSLDTNDLVIHLINNEEIKGVSIVKQKVKEAEGIVGTEWEGPAYLVELRDYIELSHPLKKTDIFNAANEQKLKTIAEDSEVFYTTKLTLRQGAYLTPCPKELFRLINNVFYKKYSQNLPHFQLIQLGESMEKFTISSVLTDISKTGLKFNNGLLLRFVSSLLTKPFVILTGLSGSGKTKLAQTFASWICENEDQYAVIAVGADWTNREPLLGFPNALNQNEYIKPENNALSLILEANKYEDKPYFLILDEMNLSHVERYFADFLSVMESKQQINLHSGLTSKSDIPSKVGLPANLFIVGTVNIDETTYMFSPKVLDRANVIEFRVTSEEMKAFLDTSGIVDTASLVGQGSAMGGSFVQLAKNNLLTIHDKIEIQEALLSFFDELKKLGAEFGYRSATEILRFAAVARILDPAIRTSVIIDFAIMQKLLPKVHGSRRKLEPVLKTLASLCLMDNSKAEDFLTEKLEVNFDDGEQVRYPLSLEKISRMYKNLLLNSFTSYAEA